MHTYNPFIKWHFYDIEDTYFKKFGFSETKDKNYIKYSNKKSEILFTCPVIDMRSIYNKANIGIFPSKAEGWCLPLIECLACGVPSIATYCTGQTEYLNEIQDLQKDLIIYDLKEEIASDGIWFRGDRGNWFIFDKEILSKKMLYAYTNYDNIEKNRLELSNIISNKFSWDLCAKRTKTAIDYIMKEK